MNQQWNTPEGHRRPCKIFREAIWKATAQRSDKFHEFSLEASELKSQTLHSEVIRSSHIWLVQLELYIQKLPQDVVNSVSLQHPFQGTGLSHQRCGPLFTRKACWQCLKAIQVRRNWLWDQRPGSIYLWFLPLQGRWGESQNRLVLPPWQTQERVHRAHIVSTDENLQLDLQETHHGWLKMGSPSNATSSFRQVLSTSSNGSSVMTVFKNSV